MASAQVPSFTNSQTSLRLLYQNNLNASDDVNHIGAILLDPMPYSQGAAACASINETLLPVASLQAHTSDFSYSLAYADHAADSPTSQLYWVQGGVVSVDPNVSGALLYPGAPSSDTSLPVLCSQSMNVNNPYSAFANSGNVISVPSNGNTYVGYRDQKSFLFLGVPFANQDYGRFEYSTPYNNTGQTITCTIFGPACYQLYDSDSAEACLFLHIQTPFIPKAGSTTGLRPVLVTIPGGGYTTGSGSQIDAGNLVSHEDIVGVQINYRLGTFGFLAVPDSDVKGNFGIGDQVTALRWLKKNIANFGGDPNRITIMGASAGASSVRVLLGSPPVVEENLIAGAFAQSSLGGGITLGLPETYSTQFSAYPTIEQSYALAGQNIFQAAGCNQDNVAAQLSCLKTAPASSILNAPAMARFTVQDGTYINNEQLILTPPTAGQNNTAYVPVIFGNTVNEAGSFIPYPRPAVNSMSAGLSASLGISSYYADSILSNNTLWPYTPTSNMTMDAFNLSVSVASLSSFRCVAQATVFGGNPVTGSGVFPATYYYSSDRTFMGYDPNGLGPDLTRGPTVLPEYPNGDPNEWYFRLHGADIGFAYGLQVVLRDADDLRAAGLFVSYVGSFVKTGQPNPDQQVLAIRGYNETLAGVQASGVWNPVQSEEGPVKVWDWPARDAVLEKEQCAWLNYSLRYYLEGGP